MIVYNVKILGVNLYQLVNESTYKIEKIYSDTSSPFLWLQFAEKINFDVDFKAYNLS